MLHVCPDCGTSRRDMRVRSGGETDEWTAVVACPACGHERSFVRYPLCIVTGAAGSGKTSVRRELAGSVDAVLLEDDCIRDEGCEFDSETAFNEYALGLCRDVAQSRVPPVLFTTGLGVPSTVEALANRRYFAGTHFLALGCDPDVQVERLRARGHPWTDPDAGGRWADVDEQVAFAERLAANDRVGSLDTTDDSVAETAGAVVEWLSAHLP